MAKLRIENRVLIGENDELYLAQGAHRPLSYLLGHLPFPKESIRTFGRNLRHRRLACEKRGIRFCHLVAPDKHSVLRRDFPLKRFRGLGERALEMVEEPFLWPQAALAALHETERAYLQTDTHWTAAACGVAAAIAARALGVAEDAVALGVAALEASLVRSPEPHIGDLGRKLDPPRGNPVARIEPIWRVRQFDNHAPRNNGRMTLLCSDLPPRGTRLLAFCDSFLFAHVALSAFFPEVLFCRTPYYHQEIVAAFQPTHVLTENVERYLASIPSDADAPPFLMMAGTQDAPTRYEAADWAALTAVLTPRHDRFIAGLW